MAITALGGAGTIVLAAFRAETVVIGDRSTEPIYIGTETLGGAFWLGCAVFAHHTFPIVCVALIVVGAQVGFSAIFVVQDNA